MTTSRSTPGIAHALRAVVVLTVIQVGTMTALFARDPEAGFAHIGMLPWHWAVFAAHAVVILLFVVFGVLHPAKMSAAELWGAFVPSRDLPWALAAFACVAGFVVGVTWLDAGAQAVIDAVLTGPLVKRLAFIAIGLMAAFAEESVFRGALQPALVRKFGAPIGIAAGAVIFSLYHLPRHPLALVGRIVTGAAYGVAAQRTGALWAGAIGHFLTWAILGTL